MTWDQDWSILFSAPTALALVATVGYFIGRCRRKVTTQERARNQGEILRALTVAQELESIAYRLTKSMSAHLPAVEKFSAQLSKLDEREGVSHEELRDRADALLKPALRLSSEVSHAYAELVQQMAQLSVFAELRTDPLTGVANRRAFDESLSKLLKQQARHPIPLSLAILDIDFFKQVNDVRGHLQGDRMLQELAGLLRGCVRECDELARYGGEEFVILMPHTELHAACSLTERIRSCVQEKLPVTISMGLAASIEGDLPSELIARADAALYLAKEAGRNCVFIHEGASGRIVGIKPHGEKVSPSQLDRGVSTAASTVDLELPALPAEACL